MNDKYCFSSFQLLAQILENAQHKVICTCSAADVKATISYLVTKIQKL